MRILLYIGILVSLLFAPVERLDVAKLEPVQTVAVRVENRQLVIVTDTKNRGRGDSVAEAVADLKKNTPGVIYLDTAQYLLLTEDAVSCCEALKGHMGASVRVSLWDGKASVENAAKFLDVRNDLPKLKTLKGNDRVP